MISRRVAMIGALSFASTIALAEDSNTEYREYPFQDYFSRFLRGKDPSVAQDVKEAEAIAAMMPKDNPYHIMEELSKIFEKGSTGEVFNARWKRIANPLIVLFFHDIGYKKTPYPGDCTPWCAATVSWCLQRAGKKIAKDPASSQSYLKYGLPVSKPQIGDLCVFTDVGNPSNGHVGFFVSATEDSVKIIGGNQSGQSTTNCGPGYRQSVVNVTELPINKKRDRSVGVHYLATIRRPA